MKINDMIYAALGAALMAVCAWISIPAAVPFTLQTFAMFTVGGLFGAKRGLIAVVIYILLGAVGLPVFSGFTGGVGVLFGTTGGYILGFVFAVLFTGILSDKFGKALPVLISAMLLGISVCYFFGTLWFQTVYAEQISFGKVLSMCVLPYIIPDLIKITLAIFTVTRLKNTIE